MCRIKKLKAGVTNLVDRRGCCLPVAVKQIVSRCILLGAEQHINMEGSCCICVVLQTRQLILDAWCSMVGLTSIYFVTHVSQTSSPDRGDLSICISTTPGAKLICTMPPSVATTLLRYEHNEKEPIFVQ